LRRRFACTFGKQKQPLIKTYTKADIVNALQGCGVQKGDTLFLSTRLFTLGKLYKANSKQALCEIIHEAIHEVIGDKGTLVAPTFSQQIGFHGLDYIHEETPCQTGIFGEYIRNLPKSIRSFHPVFSISAVGLKKEEICNQFSQSGFGYGSAMHNLFAQNAKAVCMGFDYYTGHIGSGLHVVETLYGVPYYFNKILDVKSYKDGTLSNKTFIANIRYREFGIEYSFNRIIDFMESNNHISSQKIGNGMMYACSFQDMLNDCINLLNEDIYAFLKSPPLWRKGTIPFDSVPDRISQEQAEATNWIGIGIGNGGT
jgi:aminoglycoside 3-N-acetyltransferase